MRRDSSIDALRGLAILLVVLGHAIPVAAATFRPGPGLEPIYVYWVPKSVAVDLVFSLIFAFHMPLFAFISGVVMWPKRDDSLRVRIFKRFKGLIVPYMAWAVLIYWVSVGVPPIVEPSFAHAIADAVVGRGGALWFLYALFVCIVVIEVLTEDWVPRWILPATAILAIGASSAVGPWHLTDLMYLNNVVWIYPFVVLGRMAAPFKEWTMRHRWSLVVAGTAIFVPLFYLRNPVNVDRLQPIHGVAVALFNAGVRGGFMLSIVVPYLCAFGAVTALYALYLGRQGWLIDAQAWLGRKSLGIYAIHTPLMWWMVSRGMRDATALFVGSLAVSVGLTELIERTPVARELLLGRWSRQSRRPLGTRRSAEAFEEA